jgi:hypothetical protein
MIGERTVLRAGTLAILSALACGESKPAPEYLFEQTFDDDCDEALCGWVQIAGSAGQARVGATFHAGERALILDGDGVVVRGPGGGSGTPSLTFGSLQGRLAAQCEGSGAVTITATLGSAIEGGVSRSDVLQGRTTIGEEWGPVLVTLVSESALTDGGGASPIGGPVSITGLTIAKSGEGRCLIGDITIDDVGTLEVISETSC